MRSFVVFFLGHAVLAVERCFENVLGLQDVEILRSLVAANLNCRKFPQPVLENTYWEVSRDEALARRK